MASKFGYRLTKRAESDLDGIVSYISVVLANPQAASDFVDKLQDNIEQELFLKVVLLYIMNFYR